MGRDYPTGARPRGLSLLWPKRIVCQKDLGLCTTYFAESQRLDSADLALGQKDLSDALPDLQIEDRKSWFSYRRSQFQTEESFAQNFDPRTLA